MDGLWQLFALFQREQEAGSDMSLTDFSVALAQSIGVRCHRLEWACMKFVSVFRENFG